MSTMTDPFSPRLRKPSNTPSALRVASGGPSTSPGSLYAFRRREHGVRNRSTTSLAKSPRTERHSTGAVRKLAVAEEADVAPLCAVALQVSDMPLGSGAVKVADVVSRP